MENNLIKEEKVKIIKKELLINDDYDQFVYASAWFIIEIIYNICFKIKDDNYKSVISEVKKNVLLYFPDIVNDEIFERYILSANKFARKNLEIDIKNI